MGIDNTAARMLLLLRNEPGVNFDSTVLIGRQHNYLGLFLKKAIQKKLALPKNSLSWSSIYADDLISTLLVENPEILDISNYEGATILHDLNIAIPDHLRNRFSAVIDIGTSEHIFNVPQAIRNLQDLCAPGGHVLMLNPANNWLGHGFYQFSPELFFRAFAENSGFEIRRVLLIRQRLLGDAWYELTDPEKLGKRGTIYIKGRCSLGIIAKKRLGTSVQIQPQQSDYQHVWQEPKPSRLGRIYLSLPWPLQKLVAVIVISKLDRFRSRLRRIRLKWSLGGLSIEE